MIAKSTQWQISSNEDTPKEQERDLMMSDVLGPIPLLDIHQNKYILTLQDYLATFVFCFPIKTRDQVPKVLSDTFVLFHSVFGK